MIELPLSAWPEQLFSAVIKEVKYDFRVLLNSRTGIWHLDLSQKGTDIVSGIALLPGIDIFAPYNLSIGSAYVVNTDNPNQNPSKTDLGSSSKLFILEEGDL